MTRARELAELSTAYDSGGLPMFKNRIINGDMRIDQRGVSAAGVVPITAAGQFICDRWYGIASQSSKLAMRAAPAGAFYAPIGFTASAFCESTSAYSVLSTDSFNLTQKIEGLNVSDLSWGNYAAKTVTLSFWVRSTLTGTFGGVIKNGDVTRSYPFTYTINTANTYELKSVTIPGDTSGTWLTTNGVGINVTFSCGAGSAGCGTPNTWLSGNYQSATGCVNLVGTSGASLAFSGVQLEKGSTATSFDYRPYGTELALCQRYCYGWYAMAATTGLTVAGATAGLYSDANSLGMLALGLQASSMRDNTALSVATYGTQGTDWGVYSSSAVIQTGFTITASKGGTLSANKTAHGLTNAFLGIPANNTTGKILITSEL